MWKKRFENGKKDLKLEKKSNWEKINELKTTKKTYLKLQSKIWNKKTKTWNKKRLKLKKVQNYLTDSRFLFSVTKFCPCCGVGGGASDGRRRGIMTDSSTKISLQHNQSSTLIWLVLRHVSLIQAASFNSWKYLVQPAVSCQSRLHAHCHLRLRPHTTAGPELRNFNKNNMKLNKKP